MQKTLSTKFAEFISILFNPFLLGLVIVVVAILKSKMPATLELVWIIASLVLNGAVLTFIYWLLVKAGYVFDESLQNKKILHGRLILLILLLVLVTFELLVIVSTSIYQPLFAVYVGAVLTLFLGILITNFWKISWHSTLITFFVAMLIFKYKFNAWPSLALLLLVIWSRIKLVRHNIWQLLGGVMLSIIVMLVVLKYFGLL